MKTIEIKKFSVSAFTSTGIGIYTVALTLKTPMKLSAKSEKAREQLLKKLPTMGIAAVNYPKFMVTYDATGGQYQFLFEGWAK